MAIEGVGEAVTGSMLARTVEPQAGESSKTGEGDCRNCGASLDGPYCRQCGQKAHIHRSLATMMHDIVHGVLHLDGKFWRTLPLLILKPGELTRRYVHGERAKFVSPMAMFLFSVFLMFAILQVYGVSLANLQDVPAGARGVAQQGLQVAQQEVDSQVESARARLEAHARGDIVRHDDGRVASESELRAALSDAQEEAQVIARLRTGAPTATGTGIKTGWDRLDKGFEKLNENPGLALYKLQTNFYKFSWLLIPISVPFVWLLFFWTRRFHFYDHTVFVTYSLAFMSLLGITIMLLGFLGTPTPIIGSMGVFIPAIHMFVQLKGAYRIHWASALLRTFILLNFCAFTLTIFFLLLLGIGALG